MGLKFEIIKPEVDETILPDEKPEELCERLARIKARAGIEIIKNSQIKTSPCGGEHEKSTLSGVEDDNISSGIEDKNILVIAADTIVVIDNKILGKPHDFNHAVEMLKLLQGREHEVLTGVAAVFNKTSPSGGEDIKLKSSGVEDVKLKSSGAEARSAAHSVETSLSVAEYDKFLSAVERTSVKFRDLNDEQINAYAQSGEGLDKAGAYAIQGKGALLISGIHGDYFNVVGLPLCRLGMMLESLI